MPRLGLARLSDHAARRQPRSERDWAPVALVVPSFGSAVSKLRRLRLPSAAHLHLSKRVPKASNRKEAEQRDDIPTSKPPKRSRRHFANEEIDFSIVFAHLLETQRTMMQVDTSSTSGFTNGLSRSATPGTEKLKKTQLAHSRTDKIGITPVTASLFVPKRAPICGNQAQVQRLGPRLAAQQSLVDRPTARPLFI